ncbi:MAG TPA: MXAN_6640 family putative metalloprotease [Bacteroidota bacterium]|nr:MXAN_6640 family putative metalloprotease [Bacteroidota bacterium]
MNVSFLKIFVPRPPVFASVLFAGLLLGCGLAHAAEEPGSLNRIVSDVEALQRPSGRGAQPSPGEGGKCGLWLSFEVIRHWQEFSDLQRQQLSSLLAIPARQKSRVIGHFTLFYDTTGSDAPAIVTTTGGVCQRLPGTAEEYVDSAGSIFNHVWDFETGVLGYSSPPLQGDNTYWIDIHDLGFGLYGQTFPDPNSVSSGPPPRYNTYIEIDNDFCDVYPSSRGIPGLKVTAAHEFHHAIQLGGYGYWTGDLYFYEVTSTWMEDVVYTDVNDYYQYLSNSPSLSSQFSYPFVRFTEHNGSIEYSRAVWGKFIEQRFSRNTMLQCWEFMRQSASLPSLDRALANAGSSFRQAFLEWAVWNNAAGPNCDTVRFYAEGRNYPTVRLRNVVQYAAPQKIIVDSIQALSSVYRPVLVNGAQMMVIVSNINTSSTEGDGTFSYVIAAQGDETFKHLANGVYVRLQAPDPENWSTHESVPSVVTDIVVYPNPYPAQGSNSLKFRLPPVSGTSATLTIISGTFDRVFAHDVPVLEAVPSEPFISWNGYDEIGNRAASGIYMYVISVDGKQYTGKFAIVRE